MPLTSAGCRFHQRYAAAVSMYDLTLPYPTLPGTISHGKRTNNRNTLSSECRSHQRSAAYISSVPLTSAVCRCNIYVRPYPTVPCPARPLPTPPYPTTLCVHFYFTSPFPFTCPTLLDPALTLTRPTPAPAPLLQVRLRQKVNCSWVCVDGETFKGAN